MGVGAEWVGEIYCGNKVNIIIIIIISMYEGIFLVSFLIIVWPDYF
jgi:hypothetical protein